MKIQIAKTLILSVLAGTVLSARGQESKTYISSLETLSGGSEAVASDAWWTQGFFTGPNAPGYKLDSVQLLMADASGEPAGFTVSLYDREGLFPGKSLWTLTGELSPVSAGTYDYSGDDIVLLARTDYYVVVTASQPLLTGSYLWQYRAPSVQGTPVTGGWGVGYEFSSADGSIWERVASRGIFQFAVTATPVPEPPAFALLGLAGLLFAGRGVRRC